MQETHRSSVLTTLARKYHAIGPLLTKIEGLIVYTNSGKSGRLTAYYAHWEKKVFDAIVKVRTYIDVWLTCEVQLGRTLQVF